MKKMMMVLVVMFAMVSSSFGEDFFVLCPNSSYKFGQSTGTDGSKTYFVMLDWDNNTTTKFYTTWQLQTHHTPINLHFSYGKLSRITLYAHITKEQMSILMSNKALGVPTVLYVADGVDIKYQHVSHIDMRAAPYAVVSIQ